MSLYIDGRRTVGNGSSMHNYSTSEQIVGTWIDGKTLYEKTYDITHTFSNGSNEIEVDSSDFSNNTLINFDYKFINTNGDLVQIHNKLTDNNLFIDSSTHKLIFYIECTQASSVSSFVKVRMTVRYTKSS